MELVTTRLKESSYVEIAGIGLVTFSVLYACNRALSRPKSRVVYPPGPPKDPLIGNLRQFPKDNWWPIFNEWQKEYGDIVFLDVPMLPFVIINSLDTAHELLSKRERITPQVGKLALCAETCTMGWGWSFGARPADATHLAMRKMFRHGIGPQRVASHDDLIERISISSSPVTCALIRSSLIGEIIVSMAYGRQIWNAHGPDMVKLNIEAMDILTKSFTQFWLVDIFNWRKLDHSLINDLLEANGPSGNIRDGMGILYFNVAQKVQDEIASVVGNERLPN
ncbi:9827_t:CDS:2, partial [Acaulospora colombiana]